MKKDYCLFFWVNFVLLSLPLARGTCVLYLSSIVVPIAVVAVESAPQENDLSSTGYLTFLNSVASSDPHHLYAPEDDVIFRSGIPGEYHYESNQYFQKCSSPDELFSGIMNPSRLSLCRYANWVEQEASKKQGEAVACNSFMESEVYEIQDEQVTAVNPNSHYFLSTGDASSPFPNLEERFSTDLALQENCQNIHLSPRKQVFPAPVEQPNFFQEVKNVLGTMMFFGLAGREGWKKGINPNISY